MNDKTLKVLEYDKILRKVAAHAVCEKSKEIILSSKPCFDYAEADLLQQTTEQAILLRDKYIVTPVYVLDDILPILEKADVGAMLQPADFLKIARVIKCAYSAKNSIMPCGDDVETIKSYVSFLTPNTSLGRRIDDAIAGEDEIRDSASDLLRTIRRKIVALDNKLKDKLNSYARSSENNKYLQDNIITVREGRFVLPVKSEHKGSIPGLIHDRSASGSTLYVEPFPIVELNNELKTLRLSERDEIERILKSLSSEVAAEKISLATSYEQLIKLDVIYAKVKFSHEYNCVRPRLNTNGEVHLKSCRHPLIDKDSVVPTDIALGKDYNILVVTGPNTGGKTVSLKTVGLFCLMSYSGLRIPCEADASISMFDNIFCDIGDEQSIAQSLSTFSSHITNIARITDEITPKSLVLFDELGAGTDPIEGAALAVGILKYLELVNCRAIITTHYSELKEYALTNNKLMNACMQFDENTLRPTYRLIIGLPGTSNALKIAKSLGVNDYILKNAQASLKDEKIQFENILLNAENVKNKAMEELEKALTLKEDLLEKHRKADIELAELNRKIDRINNNAKLETQKIVRKAVDQSEELIEALKEKVKIADEAALLEAKKLQNKLLDMQYANEHETVIPNSIPLDISEIKLGMDVMIRSLNTRGKITALRDKKGLFGVSSGSMTLKIPIGDLCRASESQFKSTPKKSSRKTTTSNCNQDDRKTDAPIKEVYLLGKTVSEAIEILEPYIVSGSTELPRPILRVVHGKGTGALGKGIQQYFKRNPLIDELRYGGYGEGGSGVTIITLR